MAISKTQVIHELWRRLPEEVIKKKMHVNQREMYELYKNAPDNSTLVWLLARQSGKSWNLAFIAILECLSKPNAIVKLLTDTRVHAKTIFVPIFREIFQDCPEDLRPEYLKSDSVYIFKNGSQIQMAGSDGGNAERLRGQKSDLVLVDEAGFADNLKYNIQSILLPTTTHTGGKIVIASTPSADPDHEFNEFIELAEMEGYLTKKTIYDNPLLSQDVINNIISKFVGGVNNPQFRREYLCELIKDEDLAVFPEVDEDLIKKIVREHPTPPYYHRYVAMDIGFKDLTVVLYGYYDFREDKLVIQDEIAVRGKDIHLPVFTKQLQDKEWELWINPITNELMKPEVRVADINAFVISEISIYSKKNHYDHQLDFISAEKHNKLVNLNRLRVMLASEKIIINPKCKTLIRHLMNCKWKDRTNKDDFARSPDDGHYDAVDALLYFSRAVNYNKNPYPASFGYDMRNTYVENRDKFYGNDPKQVYRQIFGIKSKK